MLYWKINLLVILSFVTSPWGYPIIGHIPSGNKEFLKEVSKLRKQHGDIFSWKMGSRFLVFLSDYKLIKELFRMVATNGPHWQEIRRFTLRHLRDLGMGKSRLLSSVHYEASELVKEIKKEAGKPGPFPKALSPAIINILWQMISTISSNIILDIFPWLRTTLPTFLLNIIAKKSSQQKIDRKLTAFFQDLVGCIFDLFGAGLETTTLTILWSCFYLASFPEVQTRLHKEIDDVIPRDQLVTLEDKSRLPFVEAFIAEVFERFSSLTSVGVPRTFNSRTLC
ncbi:cytochrome P450 1A2 [Armadillidium vulgare]|nr:cytochrome P450 1A2 [Armadillidium vulgare]